MHACMPQVKEYILLGVKKAVAQQGERIALKVV